jgi:hypothetical protein
MLIEKDWRNYEIFIVLMRGIGGREEWCIVDWTGKGSEL